MDIAVVVMLSDTLIAIVVVDTDAPIAILVVGDAPIAGLVVGDAPIAVGESDTQITCEHVFTPMASGWCDCLGFLTSRRDDCPTR